MNCINKKTGKPRKKYNTFASADYVARLMEEKNGGKFSMSSYECPTCKHYHVSSEYQIHLMKQKLATVGLEAIRQLGLEKLIREISY